MKKLFFKMKIIMAVISLSALSLGLYMTISAAQAYTCNGSGYLPTDTNGDNHPDSCYPQNNKLSQWHDCVLDMDDAAPGTCCPQSGDCIPM